MIKSRLYQRMTRATVDVIQGGGSHGALTETTQQNNIQAAYSQKRVKVQSGAFGEVATELVDVFYFERINGSLPTVKEGWVIRWDDTDYEVTEAINLGGLGKRLEVITHRIRA